MSGDDWRVSVTLHDDAGVGSLRRALHEHEVDDEAQGRLGDRVAVGEGDGVLFLYTGTRETAREAERVVREIAAGQDLGADFAIHRWHPVEERWEPEDVTLPATDEAQEAEREHLDEDEVSESEQLGVALWEVRIELESRGDADALADRLDAERETLLPGWTLSVERRWNYLLIGADNEDQADEIAKRLEAELPPGAQVHAEPSGALAWQKAGNNPFAVFGGLGT